jgi:Trypsin
MGIRVGSNEWNSGGQWRRVKQKLIPENYGKPESHYDISILFLESSLAYNKNVRPIHLNEQRVIERGTMALITGWGKLTVRSVPLVLAITLAKLSVQWRTTGHSGHSARGRVANARFRDVCQSYRKHGKNER